VTEGPSGLADRVLVNASDVVDLDRWLCEHFQSTLGFSELEASDRVAEVRDRVASLITERITAGQERGVPTRLRWIDDRFLGLNRSASGPRLRASIDAALPLLTGNAFERVTELLLKRYGADPCAVVGAASAGSRGDRGVDLVALMKGDTLPLPDRLRTLPMRVAIQAKLRYQGTVTPDDVEAFASRLENIRKGGDILALLPSWFTDPPLATVGLFVTAGRLTPGARSAAASATCLFIEGDQVAEDLARSSEASAWLDAHGQFDRALFLKQFHG
jgi:hypothetical protein